MTPPAATLLAPDAFQAAAFSGLLGEIRGILAERPGERAKTDPWELTRQALAYAAEAEQLIAQQRAEIAQLRSLSVTDELTGLYNRRGFLAALGRTLALAKRHGGSGVIAYLDLDGFKAINDAHGHAAGDAVLCRVADLLLANVRSTDVVGRLGGDEFAVLFVEAARPAGDDRARELQRMLDRTIVQARRKNIAIGVSLGLEPYDGDADAAELLRRADRGMYRDKRERDARRGRRRSVSPEAAIARQA